jgi:hypothetical protein
MSFAETSPSLLSFRPDEIVDKRLELRDDRKLGNGILLKKFKFEIWL